MIFTRHDTSASRSVDYTTFKEFVEKGYVADVVINKDNNTLTLAIDAKHEKQVYGVASKNKKPARIKVEFGSIDNLENFLDEQNKEGVFKGKVSYERDNDFISNLLWNFAPLIIIILIWIFIMRGMGSGGVMGGAGSIFSVGKSKAQLFEKDDKNSPQITFKDVAGQAGAKQEVQEIVDILKKPENTPTSVVRYLRVPCWWVLRELVRRCLPKRWQERLAFRSSPCLVPSLWRCS